MFILFIKQKNKLRSLFIHSISFSWSVYLSEQHDTIREKSFIFSLKLNSALMRGRGPGGYSGVQNLIFMNSIKYIHTYMCVYVCIYIHDIGMYNTNGDLKNINTYSAAKVAYFISKCNKKKF